MEVNKITPQDVVVDLENVAASLNWLGEACKKYTLASDDNDDCVAVCHSYIDVVQMCLEHFAQTTRENLELESNLEQI